MSIRTERVAGVIRETITEVLSRGGVKDPRVTAGGLITITRVRVSADLGVAWVAVTAMGGGAVRETVAGLQSAASYLRSQLRRRLQARRLPELRFEEDRARESEDRLEAALRDIEEERLAREGPGAEGGTGAWEDDADGTLSEAPGAETVVGAAEDEDTDLG